MAKKHDYNIFPETTKARIGLALAFVAGSVLFAAYMAVLLLPSFGLSPWGFGDWFDEMEVTYVNRTDHTVAIYVRDDLEVTVPPQGETTVDYRKIEWWWNVDVEVRDLQGRLISAAKYDEGDLKRLDYTIVIED